MVRRDQKRTNVYTEKTAFLVHKSPIKYSITPTHWETLNPLFSLHSEVILLTEINFQWCTT